MPLARTERKPIFELTAADGATGAHAQAARDVGAELRALAGKISARVPAAE